jgi:D-glycerate 3-kinase
VDREALTAVLADGIAKRRAELGVHTLIAGIAGAQGTGKTTLARALQPALAARGLHALTVSLDDFYLTHAEREQLGRDVHPLLATRGVPGTHDLALAHATLDALQDAPAGTAVAVPRFDKQHDDRAPRSAWSVYTAPIDVVIFEGWCLGARPVQSPAELEEPVNALEDDEDPDAIARTYSNAQLAGPYSKLFVRLNWLAFLRAPPDLSVILRWRTQQEEELRAATGGNASTLLDGVALKRFVQTFERITRRMLATPPRADVTIELDGEHRVAAVR